MMIHNFHCLFQDVVHHCMDFSDASMFWITIIFNSSRLIFYKLPVIYVFYLFPGKHKVSAQEILEVIFELNQSESGTPVGQSERVSENPTNSTNQSDSTAETTAHHMGQSDPAPEENQNAPSAMEASNAGK